MTLHIDGHLLRLRLQAPEGKASLRLRADGAEQRLDATEVELELDLSDWGAPEAIRQLLSLSLPPVADYSPDVFVPLGTKAVALATLPMLGGKRWTAPVAWPSQLLPLPALAGALHYAQSVFEGAKVFFVRAPDGGIDARMFRPRRNAERMWRSARALGVPMQDAIFPDGETGEEAWIRFYGEMVRTALRANLDSVFAGRFEPLDPRAPGFSWSAAPPALYVRPVLFASGPVLGVRPSDHYTLAVYVTPVGKYRSDQALRVERDHPRAYPGGTGHAKAACNYAPTLAMMAEIRQRKANPPAGIPWTALHDDVLFLDRQGHIEEMGGANFFALDAPGGRLRLRTPPGLFDEKPLDTILPGVTRESVIDLARLCGIDTVVDALPLSDLMGLAPAEARATAVFTTGTAATIAPVLALDDGGTVQRFAVWDRVDDAARRRHLDPDPAPPGSPLEAGKRLRSLLFAIQLGVPERVRSEGGDRADALLPLLERWIERVAL